MKKFEEKTLSTENIYKGIIFDVVRDKVELSNGMIRNRDVVLHNGGVVIVAQNDEKIVLVEQYRYPIKQSQLELPAGKLEKDEDPFEAAKRELLEETGYTANHWESLGYIFTSPGFASEKLYIYKAQDLTFVKQQPDEGEIIDFVEINVNEVYKLIKNGTINDAKTICGLMRAFKL